MSTSFPLMAVMVVKASADALRVGEKLTVIPFVLSLSSSKQQAKHFTKSCRVEQWCCLCSVRGQGQEDFFVFVVSKFHKMTAAVCLKDEEEYSSQVLPVICL